MLVLFTFGLLVFLFIGAVQIRAAWKRRRQQLQEIERAMREEFPDEKPKK